MRILGFQSWFDKLSDISRLIIAGPCAAESEHQLLSTAHQLSKIESVKVFRAGVWKPRTNPNNFEGVGKQGLEWLQLVKEQTNLLTCVEVATPEHVEKCLKFGVDILWLGARTVANPFSVQTIANVLSGCDLPIMVKNPVSPDLQLWVGAIERLLKVGIQKIAAIHRGFYPFENTKFRNIPKWEIPIELKTIFPDLQIINDPSHIGGRRNFIEEIASLAMCMDMDGLMIETHFSPDDALSDAKQQITPKELELILQRLKFRIKSLEDKNINSEINKYRFQIDSLDYQMLELLAKRMEIIQNIGRYKNENNISILQLERWNEIKNTRFAAGKELGLSEEFIKKIMQTIHNQSIKIQSKK